MRLVTSITCALVLLGACAGSQDQRATSTADVVDVVISASSAETLLSFGDTRTVSATVNVAYGQYDTPPEVSWTSSDPAIATVTGAGTTATITATGNGTALITASSGGRSATIGVNIRQRVATVTVSSPSAELAPGASVQLTAKALDARGHEIAEITSFIFSSSDTRIATVAPTGVVSAVAAVGTDPTATITAEVTQSGVTTSGSTKVRVRAGPAGV